MSSSSGIRDANLALLHAGQHIVHRIEPLLCQENSQCVSVWTAAAVAQQLESRALDVILVVDEDFSQELIAEIKSWLESDSFVEILLIPPVNEERLRQEFTDSRVGIFPRPFAPEELLRVLRAAVKKRREQVRRSGDARVQQHYNSTRGRMLGNSAAICRVNLLLERVAKAPNTPVLLVGESGTGKEVAAEQLHSLSPRADGPFLKINCASIPAPLIEDELFGHEKGSFTNAYESRQGLFELADGGSLLLDEVGDLDLRLQPKLLRVLQEKTIRRVGSAKDRHVDVRVLAATNQNLEKMCRAKQFREDLYFRLAVLKIKIPPLRDRREDIPLLAHTFLQQKTLETGRGPMSFSENVLDFLTKCPWPGNVRELLNMVERLVIMSEGPVIDFSNDELELQTFARSRTDMAASDSRSSTGGFKVSKPSDVRSLGEVEGEYIKEALAAMKFNKTRTADKLGVSRSTLRRKIREHGLEDWAESNPDADES